MRSGISASPIPISAKPAKRSNILNRYCREVGDRRREGSTLTSLGVAYNDLNESKKGIEFFKQGLDIAREIGDRHSEGNTLSNLGLAYVDLGESRKGIEFFKQALAIRLSGSTSVSMTEQSRLPLFRRAHRQAKTKPLNSGTVTRRARLPQVSQAAASSARAGWWYDAEWFRP
jgi:tetratricopeptide (TPR) repeat protein